MSVGSALPSGLRIDDKHLHVQCILSRNTKHLQLSCVCAVYIHRKQGAAEIFRPIAQCVVYTTRIFCSPVKEGKLDP